jgi:hypothetical protein
MRTRTRIYIGTGASQGLKEQMEMDERDHSTSPPASPDEQLACTNREKGRLVTAPYVKYVKGADTPVSHSFLPALQLRNFVYLETKNTRAVPIRAQRDTGRVDGFAEAVRALDELVAHACTAAARVVYGRGASTWIDADDPSRGVRGSALGRKEGRVDEEEQVREGGAEVGAIDRAVARRFGRVDVFAAAAVELDRLFVRDVD